MDPLNGAGLPLKRIQRALAHNTTTRRFLTSKQRELISARKMSHETLALAFGVAAVTVMSVNTLIMILILDHS